MQPYEFYVDLTPMLREPPKITASQYDVGRPFIAHIQYKGQPYEIPAGSAVSLHLRKPSGYVITSIASYDGDEVYFEMEEQMTAESGNVKVEISIVGDGNIPIGTANFRLIIEPSVLDGGVISESQISEIQTAVDAAAAALLSSQEAARTETAIQNTLNHFHADISAMVADAVEQIQVKEGQTVIDASLSVEGAAADAKKTGDLVRAFLAALVTENTVEGAIATCDDAAGGLPLKVLTAQIEPSQAGSGDPSPDNVRPISGYTGVTVTRAGANIARKVRTQNYVSHGITFKMNTGDNTVIIDGTSEDIAYGAYTYSTASNAIDARPFRGITLTGTVVCDDPNILGAWAYFKDDGSYVPLVSGTRAKTLTFVVPDDAVGFRMLLSVSKNVTVNNAVARLTLTIGDQPTEEDYVGTAYPVTFHTEAGMVYGGTLTVNSDGSGTLTVDRGCFASDEFTSHAKGGTTTFDEFFFRPRAGQEPAVTSLANTDMICSHAVRGSATGVDYVQCRMGSGQPRIVFPVGTMPTLSAFNEWLAEQVEAGTPLQFSYKLATPTTYALSAVEVVQMLSGNNAIWTDAAGTVEAEYYANTAMYAEKIVNAQKKMIAGVEVEMVATKNYSKGDLLIVGDKLYRVTTSTARGTAITEGTNVMTTTVAEQLLLLV